VTRTSLFLTGLFLLGACSKAGNVPKRAAHVFEPIKAPPTYELLSQDDKRNFVDLPMRGDARDQKHFWSDDFWPLNKGNINRRWNAHVRIGFNHRSPQLDELRTWTPEKIAELAPSEKFDLLMGRYDYPTRNEVSRLAANPNAEVWEGMINGWAVASYAHVEPQPKILTNSDGIAIPFGSEDIKGLLGYFYSYHRAPVAAAMVGKPCQKRGCVEDVSPATFHLALANTIGLKNKAFLMDLDRTSDIWNHPVVAYEAEYRGNALLHEGVTPGTHSVIRMKTTVTFIDEAINQSWLPVIGTDNQLETQQIYQYWLHLDIDGNVIGGEWKSNERPDYIWTISATPSFDGGMEMLSNLIDDPAPVVVTEETTDTDTDVIVTEETTDTTNTDTTTTDEDPTHPET
jgi:hypothetical protein